MRPRRLLVFGWLALIGLLAPGAAGQELREGDILVTDRGTGSVIRIRPGATPEQKALRSDFPHPRGILADRFGSLFLTESGGPFVLHLDPDSGVVGVVAGPYGFSVPEDILFDEAGELLVADPYATLQTFPLGASVLRLDPVVGEPEVVYAEFLAPASDFTLALPEGLALGPHGQTLYVTDTVMTDPDLGYHTGVYKIDLSKPFAKRTLEPVSLSGNFQTPTDVALEPGGTLLVADYFAQAVFRIDPNVAYDPLDPELNQELVVGGLDGPNGLYVYPGGHPLEGHFLVADSSASEVYHYDADGTLQHTYGVDPSGDDLVGPWRISVVGPLTSRADFLVADTNVQTLYRVSPKQGARTIVSSPSGLETPTGVAVDRDSDESVLVCDPGDPGSVPPALRRGLPDAEVFDDALFRNPNRVVVHQLGGETVYFVADRGPEPEDACAPREGFIARVEQNGFTSVLGPGGGENHLVEPVALAIDRDGLLLVLNQDVGSPDRAPLIRINPETGFQNPLPLREAFIDDEMVDAVDLAIDDNGDILVADQGDPARGLIPRILRLDPRTGDLLIKSYASLHFHTLEGIALDVNRELLVTDSGDPKDSRIGPTVIRVDTVAQTTSIVETGGGSWAGPDGIALGRRAFPPALADADYDAVGDSVDNCPTLFNPDQEIEADSDGDGIGDACNDADDRDGDEWADAYDNCPDTPNGPGLGTCLAGLVGTCLSDVECDDDGGDGVCSLAQEDDDEDGFGDACEDLDLDGVERSDDPLLDDDCPGTYNPLTCLEGTPGGTCVYDEDCDNLGGDGVCGQEDDDGDGFGNACEDLDGDGVNRSDDPATDDNCPNDPNLGQQDTDGDRVGDACNDADDPDGDEWADARDNCPDVYNPGQEDMDGDGVGDACNEADDRDGDEWADARDNCPDHFNDTQADADDDGFGDACEDPDGDGVERSDDPALDDNCPDVSNPDQADSDGNGVGDACSGVNDDDGDNWVESLDNCPGTYNPLTCLEGNVGYPCVFDEDCDVDPGDGVCSTEQADSDGDGFGDACEDLDGDGVERSDDPALDDNCPETPNPRTCEEGNVGVPCASDEECDVDPGDGVCSPEQADSDGDGMGDACNSANDSDDDEWADALDNCPGTPNGPSRGTCLENGLGIAGTLCFSSADCADPGVCSLAQEDSDEDGFGDACEDLDGDGVVRSDDPALDDNCPDVPNVDQNDSNGDHVGDACEACDADGDGWPTDEDNCPATPNGLSLGTCRAGNIGQPCLTDLPCFAGVVGACSLHQEDTDGDGVGDVCNDAIDSDGDEWADDLDNCPNDANGDQTDTNSDGIGNLCDADYNNDGGVGLIDFLSLSTAYGVTTSDDPLYDPDLDANSDGGIGLVEFILLSQYFGQAPGPGLPGCDGTTSPCP